MSACLRAGHLTLAETFSANWSPSADSSSSDLQLKSASLQCCWPFWENMFQNVSSEGRLPAGARSLASSAAVLSASPAGLVAQESSWLGLLSVLSRPALSFLSRYLPGLGGTSDRRPGGGEAPARDQGGDLLRRLDAAESTLAWRLGDRRLTQSAFDVPPPEPGQNPEASPSGSVVARDTRWGDPPSAGPSGAAVPGSADSGWARVLLCSPQRSKLTIERQSSVLFPGDPTGESAGANLDGGPRGVRNLRAGSPPPLTSDQDNGYYSLEEEHGLKGHKGHVGALCDTHEKPRDRAIRDGLSEKMADGRATEDTVPDETAADVTREEMTQAHATPAEPETTGHVTPDETAAAHATRDRPPDATVPPQCRNVSIAFIMGCPCSDDDDSQSDADSVREDDGFDSSALSDLSSDLLSSDEEGDDADEETARLLASLSRRNDPYNPQNFSARLRTGHAPPALSPPASSPPPSGRDARADSDSGGEADEVESLLALASLTPRDRYSLLNFRAPLSTGKAPPRLPARHGLHGGFSQPLACAKKVRFSDVVEEFVIARSDDDDGGEAEDRRGPWEELARDRGRFLRRCREAELSLAYCLQPEHRRRAYRRVRADEAPSPPRKEL